MAGTTPTKRAPAKKAASSRRRAQTAASQLLPGVPAPAGDEPDAAFTGFDLDALDKKSVLPDVTDQPFVFRLNGRVYTMMDPRDVDWKGVLEGISNPFLFMRLAFMTEADAKSFVVEQIPGWKLSALFDNWQSHFGVSGFTDLNLLLAGRGQVPGDADAADADAADE